ncbi:Superkiller protein 3, partial [Tulasnella sp. 403]
SLDGKERQKARAWWRLGRAYWEAGGDTRKTAFTHWITALKRLPTFAPAFTSLGIHYLEEASPPDHVRASKCFQKAFELDPREGEAARRLAEGFADEKEWDLVEVVASRTIAGEGGVSGGLDDSEGAAAKRNFVPTNAWAWKAMGVVELNRHNYDKAIIALQLTVRANDDDFQSWLRLGEAYAYGGRHVAALKALNRARELSPDDWTCIYVQGDVWRLIYQYDQAIEAFETVLEMRPGDAGVRIALAGTHLEHGNEEHSTGFLQRAEVSFRTAVEIAAGVIKDASGFGGMAWKIIGDGLYQLSKKTTFGDPEGVMQTLSSLLELVASRTQDDSDNPASEKLALAIAQLGEGIINGDVALAFSWAAYQTRLSVVEGDEVVASASFDVAVVLKRMATTLDEEGTKKLLEQAKVLVKTAIRANSMAAVYWNTLGALYFEDDASLAQHAFIMAIEVDKKNPAPWTNLGLLYLHHNDLELANHAFYRAQVLDPDYSLAWVGQAIVASRNNHNVEARALLEHAVGLSANIPEADLEFASRMFKLYTGPQTPGETRSTETLFLPFAVLDRYCQQRPDDATALHLYGLICERLGLNDLAIELVEKAIVVLDAAYNEKEDPETERRYAVAHIALGRLRLASSGFNGASEAYHVALSLLPVGEDETHHSSLPTAMIPRGTLRAYAHVQRRQLSSIPRTKYTLSATTISQDHWKAIVARTYSSVPPSPRTDNAATSKSSPPLSPTPSPRKKVDLHPPPRKLGSLDTGSQHPQTNGKAAKPSTIPAVEKQPPSSAVDEKVPSTSKSEATDLSQPSPIQIAMEDMRKASQHGILASVPEDAGPIRRLFHQGKELFKFYFRGLKLIAVHRRTVKDIQKRLSVAKAEGRPARMTRWELNFIKTYNQDIIKLVPFLLIVLVIEEIIPLVVLYAPGILPSTCVLPSQLERIKNKSEETRKEAILAMQFALKRYNGTQQQDMAARGVEALDSDLVEYLCKTFGLPTWGPIMLARRRLRRHLRYLEEDDTLLSEEGRGGRLSTMELKDALWDRGFVLDGVPSTDLRPKLSSWVERADGESKRLSMVFERATQ